MNTSIFIAATIDCNNAYRNEIIKAKQELKEYFGTRLIIKESIEYPFPVVGIKTELSETDVKHLEEMFPGNRATQLLILCHTEEQMNNKILYVTDRD